MTKEKKIKIDKRRLTFAQKEFLRKVNKGALVVDRNRARIIHMCLAYALGEHGDSPRHCARREFKTDEEFAIAMRIHAEIAALCPDGEHVPDGIHALPLKDEELLLVKECFNRPLSDIDKYEVGGVIKLIDKLLKKDG